MQKCCWLSLCSAGSRSGLLECLRMAGLMHLHTSADLARSCALQEQGCRQSSPGAAQEADRLSCKGEMLPQSRLNKAPGA